MIVNEHSHEGRIIRRDLIDLDAGSVTFEVDGKSVETRPLTPAEVAAFTPPPVSDDDRLADLLADLSKATTLAQVRAAAAKAADLG